MGNEESAVKVIKGKRVSKYYKAIKESKDAIFLTREDFSIIYACDEVQKILQEKPSLNALSFVSPNQPHLGMTGEELIAKIKRETYKKRTDYVIRLEGFGSITWARVWVTPLLVDGKAVTQIIVREADPSRVLDSTSGTTDDYRTLLDNTNQSGTLGGPNSQSATLNNNNGRIDDESDAGKKSSSCGKKVIKQQFDTMKELIRGIGNLELEEAFIEEINLAQSEVEEHLASKDKARDRVREKISNLGKKYKAEKKALDEELQSVLRKLEAVKHTQSALLERNQKHSKLFSEMKKIHERDREAWKAFAKQFEGFSSTAKHPKKEKGPDKQLVVKEKKKRRTVSRTMTPRGISRDQKRQRTSIYKFWNRKKGTLKPTKHAEV